MSYSVKEFRSDPLSKLLSIGISPKFKETPAIISVLKELDSLIEKINIDEKADSINVKVSPTTISFTCSDNDDNIYGFGITVFEPNDFRCVYVKEEDVLKDGTMYNQRTAIEKNIVLDDYNHLTISTFGSIIDNNCPDYRKCNNTTWSEIERFLPKGIMLRKENIQYKPTILDERIERASISSMIYLPRKAILAPDNSTRKFESKKTVLSRRHLDTAYYYAEDKEAGSVYSATVPLNQDDGLQNMKIDEVYANCPEEIIIPPAEQWEIDLMITSESNLTVQEVLKRLADGREKFSYNSNEDPHFERTGFVDTYGTK